MNHTPPIYDPTTSSVPRDRLFIARERTCATHGAPTGGRRQTLTRLAAWILGPRTPIFAPASRRTSAVDIRHSAHYDPS